MVRIRKQGGNVMKVNYLFENVTLGQLLDTMAHATEKYNIQMVAELPGEYETMRGLDVICPWEIAHIERPGGGYYRIEEVQ